MLSLTVLLFAVSATSPALPPGEGKPIVERMCSSCHALKVVTSKRASPEQWAQLVDQMVSRGAEGTDEEIETVVEYLSKNFGLDTPPPASEKPVTSSVHVNQATAAELSAALDLPSAQGEAIVSYREQNGKFKDWHDLTKVPGVDASKIEANKDHLIF
ncbi:MAG TPA: helix-hairpin-helix domain-containing protein [Terriglobales bacterium]|jgi:competence protein ComEA|nr:helix-hairpin-helix domain-containing protein [Terriglobales bacterium]